MHLRIHSNERPFKCPVCSKGCRQAQDLEKHLRTHTGKKKKGFLTIPLLTQMYLATKVKDPTSAIFVRKRLQQVLI